MCVMSLQAQNKGKGQLKSAEQVEAEMSKGAAKADAKAAKLEKKAVDAAKEAQKALDQANKERIRQRLLK